MWTSNGSFDKLECKSKSLESAMRMMARKLGSTATHLSLQGGDVVGTTGGKTIRACNLCRGDRHGTHVIKKVFWHDA